MSAENLTLLGEKKRSETKYSVYNVVTADIEQVYVRSLNRAANKTYTFIRRFIREKYKITDTDLKRFIKMTPAKANNVNVTFKITDRKIGLINFNAKQSRLLRIPKKERSSSGNRSPWRRGGGVTAEVQSGQRKLYRSTDDMRGSFITAPREGNQAGVMAVFIRQSNVSKKKGNLLRLYGPSIGQLATNNFIMDKIDEHLRAEFLVQLEKEIRRDAIY